MNCEKCFNLVNGECETMTEPFEDYSCFMTREERITKQQEMIDYCKIYGTRPISGTLKREMDELRRREWVLI